MKFEALPWMILFLPLAAAGIITLFTQRNRSLSAQLSVGAVVAGFLLASFTSARQAGSRGGGRYR